MFDSIFFSTPVSSVESSPFVPKEVTVSRLSKPTELPGYLILPLFAGFAFCCSPAEEEEAVAERPVEARSLLGEPLYAREDTKGVIAMVDAELATNPNDIELLLTAGAIRGELWHYNAAIEVYTKALQMTPDDWRPYRHRGHRYISTRRFDEAAADLEKARQLSMFSFDVSFHLGLTYYLQGRFSEAAEEFGRCMALAEDPAALAMEVSGDLGENFRSCMFIARNLTTQILITDWMYRALRRADRDTEAAELLETIAPDLSMDTEPSHYLNLLFYKGVRSEEEIMNVTKIPNYRFETLAYGVANHRLVEGNTEQAVELLTIIAQDERWPGFGRIAAEADLARLAASEQP